VHALLISLVIAVSTPTQTAGETRPLDQCIPANVMAVYFGRPSPEMLNAPPGSAIDQLAAWVMAFKSMGVIPKEGRVIADIFTSLPMIGRRPHALILLDITSRHVREDIYRLNDMQAALLIDTKGMAKEFDRRIRDLLATYTDSENGRIESLHINNLRYHRLIDQRLPEWAVIEWGSVSDLLIVTFGQGAFEEIANTIVKQSASLGDDSWYKVAHQRCKGATSGIEVFVDIGQIKARLNKVVGVRVMNVLRALHLHDIERLLWVTGFDGRALRSEVMGQDLRGRTRYELLSGKDLASPEVLAQVPAEADKYAVFRFGLTDMYNKGKSAYLNSQSPSIHQRLSDGWSRIEEEFDFNAQSGLIEAFGDHLIFHTYPKHPLGLPMLVTIWIQHKGNREQVSDTLDGMMAAWQYYMNRPAGTQPSVGLSPRINRTPDGIWYLQLGLLGPALGVADDWIVISFSPQAVRANLAYLNPTQPQQQTQPE